jgi:hypothetical protein
VVEVEQAILLPEAVVVEVEDISPQLCHSYQVQPILGLLELEGQLESMVGLLYGMELPRLLAEQLVAQQQMVPMVVHQVRQLHHQVHTLAVLVLVVHLRMAVVEEQVAQAVVGPTTLIILSVVQVV